MNEVYVWDDLDEFEDNVSSLTGIHSVAFDDGSSIELEISGPVFDTRTRSIIVLFSGARRMNESLAWPVKAFTRILESNLPVVQIADPLLKSNPELELAWFTGKPEDNFNDYLVDLIKSLQRTTGKEILFAGGNGGGYAALEFGRKFKGKSSVLTWDAHTDIYESPAKFVKPYLRAIIGVSNATLRREDWKDFCKKRTEQSIRTSVRSLETFTTPRRMVFLQQAGNSNFSQQLVSFWKTASSDELIIGTNHFDENRAIVLQDFQKDGRRRYLKTVNLILQKMCFTDSYPNVIDH
ncbi:hypothetical protein [Glutamicibacter sp. NPDC087583]|uniref:hypothetical protein n=1 Tax=Glutamicibacter sp. NPDC087583 TaxID=3363995 RepID=UPI000FA5FCF6